MAILNGNRADRAFQDLDDQRSDEAFAQVAADDGLMRLSGLGDLV
jgi:hypothetical protein